MRTKRIPVNLLETRPLPEHCAHARDQINALGRIYLEVGLPLSAAFEAAVADYEHYVGELEPCFA